MNIKKGDNVKIITGKDRGKKGKVLQVLSEKHLVVVEGLNLRVKNVRPRRSGEKGQVIRFNAPLQVSNVMVVCGKCGKPTRVRYRSEGAKNVRVCRHCGSTL